MRKIRLSHDYDADAARLWALVTDLDALAEVNRPLVVMPGMTSGRLRSGQQIEVRVSPFGVLPPQPYEIEVIDCDDRARRFHVLVSGAGVRRWEHWLQVWPTTGGSRAHETVAIDAGALTPLFALWARHLYKSRHSARQRLLRHSRQEGSS